MGKKKLSFKDIMVNYGVIIIMILLVIYTGFTSKNFLSGNNLNNILMNMSSRIVIALGSVEDFVLDGHSRNPLCKFPGDL